MRVFLAFGVVVAGVISTVPTMSMIVVSLMQDLGFLPVVAFTRNGGKRGYSRKQAEKFHRRFV